MHLAQNAMIQGPYSTAWHYVKGTATDIGLGRREWKLSFVKPPMLQESKL